VIPKTWLPHHRSEDGELLGFLCPTSAGRYVPVTVFGSPLGEDADADGAQQVLEAVGLSYLADRWLLARPQHPDPVTVEIVEASPERVRLKNVDFGLEHDYGQIYVLEAPVDGSLRRR
jgi:hypothetical protein